MASTKRSRNSPRPLSQEYLYLPVSFLMQEAAQDWWGVWAPPPNLTVSQWADRERRLSPEASAEPGRWDTSRAEYQRGIMDAVSDPTIETVVVMSSAQVGKTEVINNVVGFHVDQDPSPILVVQPTLEMGEAWSKTRLAPMIRDTPVLQHKVRDPRSRDSGNTVREKVFPGGQISIVGANSPAGLASRPIRIVLCDEVDRYDPSAGTEGDPVSLAIKRTTTFWNRKIVLTSTPTVKHISRIERAFEETDKRRFYVPCPDCKEFQILAWPQVRWQDGRAGEAVYVCEHNGCIWDDSVRYGAIRYGEWRATAPFNGTAGFHLNEIYSPWVRLGDMARAFLEAKRSPETLKTWVNTSLGETWEEDAERVDGHALMSRLEDWGEAAPNRILAITCGIDVQDDRLEVERVGWGPDEESWSLDHKIIYGDPSAPDIWRELDEYLLTNTMRQDGTEVPVHAAALDSGHHTAAVYRFVRDRLRRRVYAIKGVSGPGKPVWPKRASKNNKGRVNLFLVGVDAGKDAVYARLKIKNPGPGYCHFPTGRDAQYFEQLTAEIVQTKYVKGFPTRVYVLPGGKRNEALDCRVYGYAALQSLNVRWGRLLAAESAASPPPSRDRAPQAAPAVEAAPVVAAAAAKPARKSGWLGDRRGWLDR